MSDSTPPISSGHRGPRLTRCMCSQVCLTVTDDYSTCATKHDINELTVVTDESYTDFVSGLQAEIAESLSARPRKATPEFFAGKVARSARRIG